MEQLGNAIGGSPAIPPPAASAVDAGAAEAVALDDGHLHARSSQAHGKEGPGPRADDDRIIVAGHRIHPLC